MLNDSYKPRAELYIRHFYMLAWEDYLAIRVSRAFTPDGLRNPYLGDDAGLQAWQRLNQSSVVDASSRKQTSAVLEGAERTIRAYCGPASSEEAMDAHILRWRNGQALVC